jgi:dinuclear metal center YbgI/SA1388 family protein
MPAQDVFEALAALAPLHLAADWDNVGLLLSGTREIRTALLAIDLTEAVFDEARAQQADLIVAYHPPIFSGLKRLLDTEASGRVLLGLIREGIWVYAPHTAADAVEGGLCDWLLEAFGAVDEARPIQPAETDSAAGAGRTAQLTQPRRLDELLGPIKAHLRLDHLAVARPAHDRPIRRVAVCPGAGGSILAGLEADLLLTGEMRHHDVLAANARGTAVVLTHHTNTERGYLPRMAQALAARCSIRTVVSSADRDPLDWA